jgi:hypothetical protein
MLGLEVDAPAGTLTVAPWVPPGQEGLQVDNLLVGGDRVNIQVHSYPQRGQLVLRVVPLEKGTPRRPIRVRFAPPGDAAVEGLLTPADTLGIRLVVAHSQGWEVELAPARAAIGQRSTAPRIVSARVDGEQYRVVLEGLAGTIVNAYVQAPSSVKMLGSDAPDIVIVNGVPADFAIVDSPLKRFATQGARSVRIPMSSDGADADKYVRREVVFRSRR